MGRRAMSEELLAVSRISPAPAAQTDYDAICAALMQTERGRWFLDEYAKRNRSADTRLLLAAIERIEAVVCAERNKQTQQGFRTDLLEMAKAITRTRAEVAEIRADGTSAPGQVRDNGDATPPPRPRDVFAAAERIRDVTWAMRGHGFDPSTCNQLEELAGTILSASALRDPTDHRASKLSEVLQYLERRIDGLLESCTDGDTLEPEELELESELEGDSERTDRAKADSEPSRQALAPVASRQPQHTNGHTNGFASHYAAESRPIIEPCELEAGDFEAEPASRRRRRPIRATRCLRPGSRSKSPRRGRRARSRRDRNRCGLCRTRSLSRTSSRSKPAGRDRGAVFRSGARAGAAGGFRRAGT